MIFADRSAAGRLLAERLISLGIEKPLVLALPKGGVPVAAEIARALDGDLDLLITKRIVSPVHHEVAIGAIAEDGSVLWRTESLRYLGLHQNDVEPYALVARRELRARARELRGGRTPISMRGRTVILVDDGLATGSSMQAAVEAVRRHGPAKIIVAVPVSPYETSEEIRAMVDELIVLRTPDTFYAVGQWYQDFRDVEIDEVIALLEKRRTKDSRESPGRARPDIPSAEGARTSPASRISRRESRREKRP